MIATDIYRPAEWQNFFVATGAGAAALAGLVFVAMSINLDVVAQDATHRGRAINMLAGFTAGFMICALALMGGQNHQAVGAEWLVLATAALVIYVHNYVRAAKRGGRKAEMRPDRLVAGVTCYVAEIAGAVVLILGYVAGLYVAAVGLIISFAVSISGAWLLLVAVQKDRSPPVVQ
jgi:hypothetical protein